MVGDVYLRGESFLHHLDPRSKLIVLCEIVVFFFLPFPVWLLALYFIGLVMIVLFSLGVGELLKPVLTIMPILILVLVLTPPLTSGGRNLLVLSGHPVLTTYGLLEALRMIVRFTGITVTFYIYFRTTSSEDVVLSLKWFKIPFGLSLVMTITMRYIPHMATVYRNVIAAHRLRRSAGTIGKRRGLFRRLRDQLPVLTSVLLYAVKGIPALAMALESRGVGRKNSRSSYLVLKSLKKCLPEFLMICVLTTVLVGPVFVYL